MCVLVLFFVTLPVYAQSSASSMLQLDESSLTPEERDVITGHPIDPIPRDRSNRPCARIKLRVSRMTPEEISQLEVQSTSGTIQVTHKISQNGDGLIIELTARKGARFHLYHKTLGYSNEVIVDLEGDKQYRMEAWNSIVLPVTVVCMSQGAEVYLDETYRGIIGEDHMLTIQGVTSGMHNLRLVLGEEQSFQQIAVSTELLSFNVELKDKKYLHGQLTFNLEPANAVLEIDGETLTSADGVIARRTMFGSYDYRVSAEGYHPVQGTVVIDTEELSRNIVLKQMVTNVTLNASDDVKVMIDGKKVSEGTWTGNLSPGTYEVKTKKTNHYPAFSTLTITPETGDEMAFDTPVPSVPYEKNLLAQVSASIYPRMSCGVMLGYVQTIGGYVKFRSNFNSTKGLYNAASDLNIEGGGYFWPSGDKAESVMNVSGGMLLRATKSLYPYFGVGYGSRKMMWQDAGGKWANITDYTYTGISADAGLIFKLGPVALSAGVSTTAFKYTAAEVGIGVML